MSVNKYIISDLHLSHLNMAIKRGFKNIEEHDQFIIDRWNSVVQKHDVVYILGDITMEKKAPYHLLDQMKGLKNAILGNHDRRQDVNELLKHVNSVCGCKSMGGNIFTHIPVHPSQLDRFKKNIHGHLHDENILIWKTLEMNDNIPIQIIDDRYVNVSCEQINYTPVLINEL